ncbi:MAG: clostripain-related cysteine peptidase [Myxococcota bacterium]|nr:clostripain-related cysteine peptidase [Myxococcota bacterium]
MKNYKALCLGALLALGMNQSGCDKAGAAKGDDVDTHTATATVTVTDEGSDNSSDTHTATATVTVTDEGSDTPSDTSTGVGSDSHSDVGTDTGEGDMLPWKFLVYMNADNDLESYYFHDMNELEAGGADENVVVLVQADRIRGYADDDGNWTDARRYQIKADNNPNQLASEMLEIIGEVDMGDPATLVDFVAWADALYPSKRTALMLWDHGDSWRKGGAPKVYRDFSSDSSSGSSISVAQGEYEEALASIENILGKPLDVVGFDACTMAAWEVAMVSAKHALVQASSETYTYSEGFNYTSTLATLRADPGMNALQLGAAIARGASVSGEYTQSALDLTGIPQLTLAVDSLAKALLDLNDPGGALSKAVSGSLTLDPQAKGYYHDLGGLAAFLRDSANGNAVSTAAKAVLAALDEVVATNYTLEPFETAMGITICATDDPYYTGVYSESTGAIWAQQTAWDDLLLRASK